MIFKETPLKGAFVIELEKFEDNRGFFARSWCQREFKEHGLDTVIAQCNISYSKKKGTLRGMHFQIEPHSEVKMLRCVSGAIYDVIIDLRHASNTYSQWFSVELSSENYKMIYVPKGFAHGYQTLKDNTVVFYQMSEFYYQECERGARFDDPYLGIKWPIKNCIISMKDALHPMIKKK